MSEFDERGECEFFGHLTVLSIEERNDLNEYLTGLQEYQEWDETRLLLRLKEKVLEASARSGTTVEVTDKEWGQILPLHRRYKELGRTLGQKAKTWCRAMVDEAV